MQKQNINLASIFMFFCAFFTCAMTGVAKYFSDQFPLYVIIFFRFFFPWILTIIPILFISKLRNLKTKVFGLHLLRAITMLAGTYLLFITLTQLPLLDANLLWGTSPLFIPIFGWLLLKEKVSKNFWWMLLIAFIGLLMIIKPGHELFNPITLVGLSAGICLAIASVILRKLTETETTNQCIFYYLTISTAIIAIPVFLFGTHVPQDQLLNAVPWYILLIFSLSAWAVQYFRTLASALAPVAIIGVLMFITIPISGLIDWVFWKDIPDLFTILGALIIFSSAYLIIKDTR